MIQIIQPINTMIYNSNILQWWFLATIIQPSNILQWWFLISFQCQSIWSFGSMRMRIWQGKLKYPEETCPSATLSSQIPLVQITVVGSQRLIAWALAQPIRWCWRVWSSVCIQDHCPSPDPLFYFPCYPLSLSR
jgi:hypothetical protein